MSKRITQVVIVVAVLSCALPAWAAKKPSGGGGGSGGSSSATPVKMWISASGDILGDGQGQTEPDLYTDATIPGSTDPCVSGGVNSTGFAVVYPDRQLSDGTFCNADPTILGGHPARTYTLHLSDSTGACEYLAAALDANGYCTVTADVEGYQRFELGSPFARKPSSSGRFAFDLNGSRWSVITDGAAMVQSPDANTRVISYTGTAKLNQVIDSVATPKTESFPFTFSLTVQRVN
jgi:hypothetical protein